MHKRGSICELVLRMGGVSWLYEYSAFSFCSTSSNHELIQYTHIFLFIPTLVLSEQYYPLQQTLSFRLNGPIKLIDMVLEEEKLVDFSFANYVPKESKERTTTSTANSFNNLSSTPHTQFSTLISDIYFLAALALSP
jgi:hypothetical protein